MGNSPSVSGPDRGGAHVEGDINRRSVSGTEASQL